jgi:hypothetical protein
MKKLLTKYLMFMFLCVGGYLVSISCKQAQPANTDTTAVTAVDQTLPQNDTAGWKQLFNGKDLTGWTHVGPGFMTVENSLIQTHGGMGLLYWAGGKVGKCTLRVVFRMRDENDNSGIFIRIPEAPKEEWMPVNKGYEVQIDNHPELSKEDEYHSTGMLYSLTKPLAIAWKPGPQWNTMEITLDGPHTVVVLNGVKVTDFKEGDPVPAKKFDFEPARGPRPDEGYFGLQNHSDNDIVFFKEVAIKPLAE